MRSLQKAEGDGKSRVPKGSFPNARIPDVKTSKAASLCASRRSGLNPVDSEPSAQNLKPYALDPQPWTLNLKPCTLKQTFNPKPACVRDRQPSMPDLGT